MVWGVTHERGTIVVKGYYFEKIIQSINKQTECENLMLDQNILSKKN